MGEDALTSYNLTLIAAAGLGNVYYEDTRINEATKGCDFELWIGSAKLGWCRYAIQAKKIKLATERYESLGHKVAGAPQIDILEKYANANKAIPLYCFYNYTTNPVTSNCTDPNDIEQLGCTVTPLAVVKQALSIRGSRNFSYIHRQRCTLPWRCLVKCPVFLGGNQFPFGGIHRHAALPPNLEALQKRRSTDKSLIPDLSLDGVFNRDIGLRPARLLVVDVGEHEG
jgi:hypothetical protein